MDVKERELYRSSNGDSWYLSCDTESGQIAVKHVPNAASGGQTSLTEIGAFLTAGHHGPEHRELLRLIASLVDDRVFASERSSADGGPERRRLDDQDDYQVEDLARRHGISNDQASRLMRQMGGDRKRFEAEAEKMSKR
jgi:hypothetical protein